MIELLRIDSTNNYALSLLKSEDLTDRQELPEHGWAVFAHEQYAGKGQRGKLWQSQSNKNVHVSVVLDPHKMDLERQFTLIAIVALAVRAVFERYAQSDILIKWPNDIYWRDRKAGGILIENIIAGQQWKWAVAGVGLNINQVDFSEITGHTPISLKQITGKNFDCLQLAREIQQEILLKYDTADPITLMKAYNLFLFKKNEMVTFIKDGAPFSATVKEVLPNGQLLVKTHQLQAFDFGAVSWVPGA